MRIFIGRHVVKCTHFYPVEALSDYCVPFVPIEVLILRLSPVSMGMTLYRSHLACRAICLQEPLMLSRAWDKHCTDHI